MGAGPPQLRRNGRGYWFVRYAGHDHYIGKPTEARRTVQPRYREQLRQWSAWRDREDLARRSRRAVPERRVGRLAELFLRRKALDSPGKAADYRRRLRWFVGVYELVPIDQIRPADLEALVSDGKALGMAPRTIKQALTATRHFLRWAAVQCDLPPRDYSMVPAPPLPPPPDKSIPWPELRGWILSTPPHIAAWLAVIYLTGCRPSEMVTLAHGRGRWVEPWCFECVGKSTWRTRDYRRLILSDEARTWFTLVEPRWGHHGTFACTVRRRWPHPGGPHRLRHSAAAHLQQLGATREAIDAYLGHTPARTSRTYTPLDYASLRATAKLLTLRESCAWST